MTIPYGRDYGDTSSWEDEDGVVRHLAEAVPGSAAGRADDEPDSWAPIDLGPYVRGEVPKPAASIGMGRNDGVRFLYPGKEHVVAGEMESGKSWFALGCVAIELLAGHHVVYAHFEEADPAGTVERLMLLDVPAAVILARFRFVAPERMVSPDALRRLLTPSPSLVVLDGVNEGMSLHQQKINDPDGAAEWRRNVVKPCKRTGAAVLACDHVKKESEGPRGRYAFGSVHKGNALDGAQILLENAEPFGRGVRGRSHVYVTKDRPGTLRQHGRPTSIPGKTLVGELVADDSQFSSPDFLLRLYALRPEEQTPADADGTALADVVHEVVFALDDHTVASGRELFARMRQAGHKHRDQRVLDAVADLIVAGRMEVAPGSRGAKGYRATAAQDHKGIAP